MATNNAVNLKTSGVVSYDGAGTFSASTLTQYSLLVGGASNAIASLGAMTDGQLAIGKTGAFNPVLATITPGANISITNGPGSIQIAASGGAALTYTEVTTNTAMAVNSGYIPNSSSRVGFTLPATAAQGTIFSIVGKGSGGWSLAPNVGQTIYNGSTAVTYPSIILSSNAFNTADLVTITANTVFNLKNAPSETLNNNIVLDAAMSASGFYLKSDGSAWAWGQNTSGQLGIQSRTNQSSPVAMVGNHSFIAVGVGDTIFCGLKADGSMWTCGLNNFGQLGNYTTTSYSSPIQVVGNHSFIQIAPAYSANTYALKADGSVWAWGDNTNGQLGQQNTTSYSSPVQVVGNHSFIQVGGCQDFACGLKADGSVWSWGVNGTGNLGDQTITPKSSPVQVVGNHSFILITGTNISGVTSYFNGALKSDGSVWTWGSNAYGALGINALGDQSSPVQVVGNHSFISLMGGRNCFYALKADGVLWSWGRNDFGQLGDQSMTDRSSPVQVVGNTFYKLPFTTHDKEGNYRGSACALKADGTMWAWGFNDAGQLGQLNTTSYSSPVMVLGLP